jgi:glycosyltransferase involved in cell wall biosynthesis
MNKKLSVALATFNEENNLKDCLLSIKNIADEIIVVDGSSHDKTVQIARNFKANVYIVANQTMFHKNKRLALEKATADWILQLDADERVTSSLRDEIKNKILNIKNTDKKLINNKKDITGYCIARKNYFLGKWLKKGGQYPDYVIRLVQKGYASFPCKSVHEQIQINGKVGYLENDLIHLSSPTIAKYWQNANRYTTLTSQELNNKKVSLNLFSQLKYLFLLPIKTFINIYFRHKGFLDGFPGFLFALFSCLHDPISFLKYWENTHVRKSFNPPSQESEGY